MGAGEMALDLFLSARRSGIKVKRPRRPRQHVPPTVSSDIFTVGLRFYRHLAIRSHGHTCRARLGSALDP